MNPRARLKIIFFSLICIVSLLLPVISSPSAAQHGGPAGSPDVVVKISRLEKALEVIDALAAAAGLENAAAPSAMVKGTLHGTDWIDFSRPVVIGIALRDPKPDMALLIPFKTPRPEFQAGFQAAEGPDYYFLSFPPGSGKPPEALEQALASAARSRPGPSISAEIAVDVLMKKVEPKIRQALETLKTLPPDQRPPNPAITPEALYQTALKLTDTLGQFRTVDIRGDLSSREAACEMALTALPGSQLAGLFSRGKGSARLAGYRPSHAMHFSSRPFETDKMLALIGDTFGIFYQSMGIDFSKIVEISSYFTGEMAGGMSYLKDGISLEMIHVLKKESPTAAFIPETYLPWLTEFGKVMQRTLEAQLKTSVEPILARTPDSTIAGHPVYGVRFKFPLPPMPQGAPGPFFFKGLGGYAFRMTVVDDLLLSASTDEHLKSMIQTAATLKPSPAKGPLMTFEYDLTAYLESLKAMLPDFPTPGPIPRLGKMVTVLDADAGRASLRSAVEMQDVQTLIAYFKGVPPSGIPTVKTGPETASKKASEAMPSASKAAAASPWIEKGIQAAFRGDTVEAVDHFQKAVELEPDRSDAHFHLGVALGELGAYPKAAAALGRAIALNPQKGVYRYARGRVFLLSGERNQALADFNEAADLGDPDARNYLRTQSGAFRN